MFAVIKTGGKQYKVQVGSVLKVEKLAAEVDSTVTFDEVVLVGGETTKSWRSFSSWCDSNS